MISFKNVTKIYALGKGSSVTARARGQPGDRRGRVRGHRRPVGVGQDHAAQPGRRVDPAHVGPGDSWTASTCGS